LDSALADLRYAFAFWRNEVSLEGMPDPTKDPSFKRFLENERFKTLAQQVCPKSQKTTDRFVYQ
jgi:hypothetical protein